MPIPSDTPLALFMADMEELKEVYPTLNSAQILTLLAAFQTSRLAQAVEDIASLIEERA